MVHFAEDILKIVNILLFFLSKLVFFFFPHFLANVLDDEIVRVFIAYLLTKYQFLFLINEKIWTFFCLFRL